ncbi:MAG TPA: ABC transporter permease [candidate division Zixibacteria bacterium]|nr:ABC transporter permease [candidate division Zixibacteria bacterium]
MRNIWIVIKHEVKTVLRKRSFWILSFIVPVLLLGFQGYAVLQDNDISIGGEDEASAEEESGSDEITIIGLVDNSGLITEIPDGIPSGKFLLLDGVDEARASLDAGEIEQYVVLPEDYIGSGEITIYDKDFQLMQAGDTGVAFGSANEWMLPEIINYNLIGDESLSMVVFNPTPGNLVRQHALNPPEESSAESEALAEFTSVAIPYVYYFILIIVSGYILQSVTSEKENRTVEVILVSLQPDELMSGKLLGMTFVALIQLLVWGAGASLILNQGSRLLDVSGLSFTPAFFIVAIVFLLLGYLLYASVMAAAGALANSAREASQVTWLLVIPLLPTLMFGRFFVEDPDSVLAIFLSLFPFSSPSAMVTRMAVGSVPAWQVLFSLFLLLITVYVVLMMATRFFQPQNLLSQAQFSWRRLATGWREK